MFEMYETLYRKPLHLKSGEEVFVAIIVIITARILAKVFEKKFPDMSGTKAVVIISAILLVLTVALLFLVNAL